MADNKPEMIDPPNTLKSKVGVGGPGAVDPETLKRAEQVISDLADNYLEWAHEDMAKLQAAFEELKVAEGDQTEQIAKVFQVSHDMKGQGGSFGYDLITIIGNGLCRYLEDRHEVGPAEMEAINLHVGSIQVVLMKEIKGDGGEVGAQLLKGLEQVIAKVSK